MTKTAPARSSKDLQKETVELVQKGVILYPDLPAFHLAEILVNDAESADFLTELSRALTVRHLALVINAERRKQRKLPQTAPLFEGLDHLPRSITVEGRRQRFAEANRTQLRAYVKGLNARHKERIADVQAVLKLMEKYARNKRGVRVAAVAAIVAAE